MMEDNSAHFFEGTEKLLEVWFSRQDETKGTGDLRTIPRFVSFKRERMETRNADHMLCFMHLSHSQLKETVELDVVNALI